VADRPLRADAQRNRERLLDVALRAFSEDAGVSLDAIARQAGVGSGTLYRHFPTREALIEAAYRHEVARLCDSASELLRAMPPDRALREWMGRYSGYVATKHGMGDALAAVIASGSDPYRETPARLIAAVTTLASAGVAAGTIRDDVPPVDILYGIIGVCRTPPADPGQRDRLLDLLMDSVRRHDAASTARSARLSKVPGGAASECQEYPDLAAREWHGLAIGEGEPGPGRCGRP
jgi:AcrR family transcriptional regulator